VPKAGDFLNFPSIESGLYGASLLEVVELASYNSHYSAPLHLRRLALPPVLHVYLRQMRRSS